MPPAARAALESLLRARKLDTTLTSALPLDWRDVERAAPTGLPPLDERLHGGLPRGEVSEIVGPRSSGRTSLLRTLFAEATCRGELVALIDTLDRFDPATATAAGVDVTRVLWVRGDDVPLARQPLAPAWEPSRPSPGRARGSLVARALDRALKALGLVLQSGGFGLVALDLADVPAVVVRDLPFNTWMRLHRRLEGSETACVLLADVATARSTGGISIRLQVQRSPRHDAPPAAAAPAHSGSDRSSLTLEGSGNTGAAGVRGAGLPGRGAGLRPGHDRAASGSGHTPRPRRLPSAGALDARAFHEAVLASRHPFVPRADARGAAGRWSGPPLRRARLRGLGTEVSIVRAQRLAQPAAPLLLEFGD